MPAVTEAALKERARQMLVDMTERSRWIYALVREGSIDAITAAVEQAGLPRVAHDAGGSVAKYANVDASQSLVVFDQADLDVVHVEAAGDGIVPLMQTILEATGFIPQSQLWQRALAIGEPGSGRALRILAHMVVSWDDDWTDLFLLHLASPDAVVRNDAALSTTLAAMVARDVPPALELLAEAERREKFPQLATTLAEARRVLEAYDGRAVDVAGLDRDLGNHE
jgi:hypothetical protein